MTKPTPKTLAGATQAALSSLQRLEAGENIYEIYAEFLTDKASAQSQISRRVADDRATLAAFMLARPWLVSEADEGAITEEALRAMGCEQRSSNGYKVGAFTTLIYDNGWGLYYIVGNMFHPICSVATCGQLRAICRSLGITLKEQPNDCT